MDALRTTLSLSEAELLLAGLFRAPDPEREEEFRRLAARTDARPECFVWELEKHGLLGWYAHNVETCGASLPASIQALLERRREALRADAQRDAATLAAYLPAVNRAGISVCLLKGASLALDRYPQPGMRAQGDVDLLVHSTDLRAAVHAGETLGLVPHAKAFPIWWYRLTHFHLKLAPVTPFLREVELHWRLSSPVTGWRADPAQLWGRSVETHLGEHRCRTLDPQDRLLHLATHLVSHVHGRLGTPGRAWVLEALTSEANALRLKWLFDLVLEVEAVRTQEEGVALCDRARAWGATRELAWCLATVRDTFGLRAPADAWVEEVCGALPRPDSGLARGPLPRDSRAHPVLGFRLASLRRLPSWFWPERGVLEQRRGLVRARPWHRAGHALGVLGHLLVAAAALPFAYVGRFVAEVARRRARERALSPEHVLDAAVAWRRGPGA